MSARPRCSVCDAPLSPYAPRDCCPFPTRPIERSCQSCGGTGRIQWATPPHRDDPRYAYNCMSCSGTGNPDLATFEITPTGLAYLNDPPRGGNAAWVKEQIHV